MRAFWKFFDEKSVRKRLFDHIRKRRSDHNRKLPSDDISKMTTLGEPRRMFPFRHWNAIDLPSSTSVI